MKDLKPSFFIDSYLNNRLKDGTRQACIDLILGIYLHRSHVTCLFGNWWIYFLLFLIVGIRSSVTEEELTLGKEAVEDKEITPDLILQMIEDVKHTVVPVQSVIVGSWGLVNAK